MDFFSRLITALSETHPIHPMVVHFPIGLTGAALLFILLALWKNKEFFEQAAFAMSKANDRTKLLALLAGHRTGATPLEVLPPTVNFVSAAVVDHQAIDLTVEVFDPYQCSVL